MAGETSSSITANAAANPSIIIVGAGIGGLTLALTLHQIGVSCVVLEQAPALGPLGVGINIQPNAVRELYDLGIDEAALADIGIPCREWALLGRNGREIYAEPRGLDAGYRWPQFSVHRGRLQMLLLQQVIDRLGPDAVKTGHQVLDYDQHGQGVTVSVLTDGHTKTLEADALIGADGIRSRLRQRMNPSEGDVHWGGAIMWRGVTRAKPIRTGASFVGIGSLNQRFVCYPISQPDSATGLVELNWIAEITVVNKDEWSKADWNRSVDAEVVLAHFKDWQYTWLDVPAFIRGAPSIFEYPMIDRDPIDTWVDGRVALMGDAAHAMYPTGSNGASQAIVDARMLGAMLLKHGDYEAAFSAFDAALCEPISALVLRNRGAGPFALLGLVDDRCNGEFEDISQVIPKAEMDELMGDYKRAAGYAKESLNQAESLITNSVHSR